MSVKIFTATYKQTPVIKNNLFQPIHAGKALSNTEIPCTIGDDTGDNISHKNPNYCELTALYWIWKNYKGTENIIGLSQYRRFFNFVDTYTLPLNPVKNVSVHSKKYTLETICAEKHTEKIERILKNYDIILPAKRLCKINRVTPVSIANEYKFCHIPEDFDFMVEILKKDKTQFDYRQFLYRTFYLHYFNMFITKRVIFNDYCEWLFTILENLEYNFLDISSYPVQKRVFGYLGERLLNVYVKEKKLKVKNLQTLFVKEK